MRRRYFQQVFHPPATGQLSRRLNGVVSALSKGAETAREAASVPGLDERQAAMLRGKAQAYREARDMVRAVDQGWKIPRRKWEDA